MGVQEGKRSYVSESRARLSSVGLLPWLDLPQSNAVRSEVQRCGASSLGLVNEAQALKMPARKTALQGELIISDFMVFHTNSEHAFGSVSATGQP